MAALALAGCGLGNDGTIPESNADDLLADLQAIQDSVEDNNCGLAQDQAQEFTAGVDALPSSVDEEVRSGLTEAAAQLTELASDDSQCDPPPEEGATGEAEVVPEDTATQTTTEATTTTTAEPVEETTTEEPPPEEVEEPVEEETEAPPAGDSGAVSGGSTGGIGGGGG